MTADTTTADAFADGQREAREADRRALVAALGLPADTTWAAALSYATRHAEDNTDPTLQGMCRTSNAWMQTAAMHARNEDYYRGLLVACATHLGPAVYVQDDGGVVIDPLLAKVPELVAAMREHIATLTTTLDAIRSTLDHIAAVGWDASCESAASDALESEDATRLNRYAVRVARERDEARAQLATARRTLSALDCRYTGGGVADVSGSHCPLGAPCERCAGERGREEARESEPAPPVTTIYDVEGDL